MDGENQDRHASIRSKGPLQPRCFDGPYPKKYHLAPAVPRRKMAYVKRGEGCLTLDYRPPYGWERLLDFFSGRAIPGVETVRDGEYFRTVRLVNKDRRHVYGWLRVSHRPQNNILAITLDASLLSVWPQVISRVRHLFDLNCDPKAVFESLSPMNKIQPGLCVPGTRLPGCFDAFEMAVRAVLGQQITVKAACTLAGRFVKAYGVPIQTGIEGLAYSFPFPETILALSGPIADHLGPLGITGARSKTILELARAAVLGTVDFSVRCVRPEKEIKKLMELPGIGSWTAHYIAMRAMGWPDAFPHTDYGIKKALAPRTPKEILALGEDWRPWRSYATINLWNSL